MELSSNPIKTIKNDNFKRKINNRKRNTIFYLLFNPTLLQLDGAEISTGRYVFTSDTPVFNSDLPPKWYIANSQGLKYAVSQTSRTTFEVSVYDNEGAESGSDLSGVEIQVEL